MTKVLLHHESRVLDAIGRLEPEYRELLQQLVRIPSPVGDEAAAQQVVAERMRVIGLDVDSFDIDAQALGDDPAFNRTLREYHNRPCVIGRIAGKGDGRSLLLNAHIDTVPVDQDEKWSMPPYGGVIDQGRIYGRGACDDKAGIVEILLVAHALIEAGAPLAGDFVIASVIEDESSGNGSLAAVRRGYTADGVIIVDGTWPERFIVSHLGQVTFRIRIAGVAGHATSRGPNPIESLGAVVAALQQYVATRNAAHARPWGSNTSPFFVNFGTVHGGVWPGSVPAACVLEGQVGFPPPETCERMKQALGDVLAEAALASGMATAPAIEFVGLETPPHIGDPSNPLAQLLTDTVRRRQGAALVESIISGHCDLRHYTASGAAACLYGPGGGRNVHGADEYFELEHLSLVAGNLAGTALRWCGVTDAGR